MCKSLNSTGHGFQFANCWSNRERLVCFASSCPRRQRQPRRPVAGWEIPELKRTGGFDGKIIQLNGGTWMYDDIHWDIMNSLEWWEYRTMRVLCVYINIYISVDILVYKDHNDNNDIIAKILNDDYITTSTIVIMMKISIMRIRMNRMIRWKIILVIISRCLKIKNSANQGRIQPGWWMPGVHPQKSDFIWFENGTPAKG